MANRSKFTLRAKKAFLEVLRTTCNVSEAALMAGVSRTAVYAHRRSDEAFATAWDSAEQEAADVLEREAWRRGVEGVDRPVVYKGEITATYKEYSDRMLEILLKGHRPEKFAENHKHQVEHGGAVKVVIAQTDIDCA